MAGWADGWVLVIDGWMKGWREVEVGGLEDGWMDGWMDGYIHGLMYSLRICVYVVVVIHTRSAKLYYSY